MQRIALVVFALAVGGAALVIVATSGELPARVASHFGAGGRPNDWMARETYLAVMLGFAVALPVLLVASMTLLPRVAPRLVNLPNRDYWLAPARREASIDSLGAFGCGLGVLTALLLAGVHLLVVAAHRGGAPRLDERAFLTLVGIFLAAMGLLLVMLLRRFRKVA
jgi:uncharacterized membrane protein